eukprot:7215824-Pyramimonas_sp.AAC.1
MCAGAVVPAARAGSAAERRAAQRSTAAATSDSGAGKAVAHRSRHPCTPAPHRAPLKEPRLADAANEDFSTVIFTVFSPYVHRNYRIFAGSSRREVRTPRDPPARRRGRVSFVSRARKEIKVLPRPRDVLGCERSKEPQILLNLVNPSRRGATAPGVCRVLGVPRP